MASRGGDKRRNQTHQVVVHVACTTNGKMEGAHGLQQFKMLNEMLIKRHMGLSGCAMCTYAVEAMNNLAIACRLPPLLA